MAKTRARTGFTPKLISIAVASCFVTGVAFANPTGPTVVNGTVNFHQQGNLLRITNSPSAIIHWQSFSIGASEITRFLQQSASSAVLNRVITQNPSSILGALQSNGRVFLINPNGILFGAGAQIDVAGLVASTLNLSNADFLAGRLRFTEVPGAGGVINQGNITAAAGGQVYLVGSSVTNSGIITSPTGEVVLAAGNSVELVNPGTPNLRVEISAPDNEARNLGHIVADAGRVGIYAGLINHSGTIRADSAVSEGGRIVLKATRSATLENSSLLSVQGNGGGEIVVLAGETVQVGGRLDASAPNGGDGGFIETSGARVKIEPGAIITTYAPYGRTGTWLIDPPDFIIGVDMTGAALSTMLGFTNTVITSDGGEGGVNGDIFVNDTVSWSANFGLTLAARRNVNVNSSITSTGGGTVAMFAGWNGASTVDPQVTQGTGDITVNAPITVSDATSSGRNATIKLTAGAQIKINNDVSATGGNNFGGAGGSATVTLNAGTGIKLDGGRISAQGGGGSSANGGDATATLRTTTGDIELLNFSSIQVDGGEGFNNPSGVTTGGKATVTLNADAGGIKINNSFITANGGAALNSDSDRSEFIVTAKGGDAEVKLTASGSITVENFGSVNANGGRAQNFCSSYCTSFAATATGGKATITLDPVSITVNQGFIAATGGNAENRCGIGGSFASCSNFTVTATGGAAEVKLTASDTIIVQNLSSIDARGGRGENVCGSNASCSDYTATAFGGAAKVTFDPVTITVNNSFIDVDGGWARNDCDGNCSDFTATASGGKGEIVMTAGTGGIQVVNNSRLDADGAEGGLGRIHLSTAGSILVENSNGIHARGGDPLFPEPGVGGEANVTLNAGGSITLNNSTVEAHGGSGSGLLKNGGGATVTLSGGSVQINTSFVEAFGGRGSSGNGGNAMVSVSGNGITVGSSIRAEGGSGYGPGNGGNANVALNAGSGALAVNNATVEALGGFGSDGGGAANLSANAGAGITVNGGTLSANGGGAESGPGGNGNVALTTGGSVAVGSSVNANGGSGSPDGTGRIDLTFLSPGGTYLVNGVTAPDPPAIDSDGFFVDGPAAQLNVNFFVHMPSAEVPVPDTCALLASAGMCGGGEGSNPLGAPPLEEPGLGAPDDEKKKQLPICGAGTGR